jgi:hypothetical protein
MIGIVPEASACRAFAAVGVAACWAYSSFPRLSDHRHLDRPGPLAPGFDGFSWSDHQCRGRSGYRVLALQARMDLPGHRLSRPAAEPLRNLPRGPERLA